MSTIKVALLGLGEIGQEFAENFLSIIQEKSKPIEIVAVAHDDPECPLVMGFRGNGVAVFDDALDILSLNDDVDIIFDLTGNNSIRQGLRQGLQKSGNTHTVIAPEVVAELLWMFFEGTDNPALAEHMQTLHAVGY